MQEITFNVERDEEADCFVASWDDPSGKGGITTQGEDLRELQEMIFDAATGYFHTAGVPAPKRVRLHFASDPQLALA
ncbi:MAG: hypothetical protein PHD76_01670 [Methylacidiphilales bacterium]|nr:hypothetical protein [Candidatus Methylacidiphilales bacterium]